MAVDLSYFLTPFLAWAIAGTLKFAINSMKAGKLAFGLIGYGGLPSNHSAIVASIATLIGLKEGIGNPAFGVAVTLAFIVVLDATSLRRHIGRHAEALNRLTASQAASETFRTRMGHTSVEVIAGIAVGAAVAAGMDAMFR